MTRVMDQYVQCPYDNSHQILATRIKFHIANCTVREDGADTVTCPFNPAHQIPKAEVEQHITVCADGVQM